MITIIIIKVKNIENDSYGSPYKTASSNLLVDKTC